MRQLAAVTGAAPLRHTHLDADCHAVEAALVNLAAPCCHDGGPQRETVNGYFLDCLALRQQHLLTQQARAD